MSYFKNTLAATPLSRFTLLLLGLSLLSLNTARATEVAAPNAAEVQAVISHLPPPYDLELSTLAELVYRVPTARLEKLVPPPFKAVGIAGSSFVSVLIAHYSQSRSLATGSEGGPYDEICYVTQVTYQGKGGNFYFKLHLNSRDGWILGRQLYGYPKDLATLSIQDTSNALSVQVTSLQPGAQELASLQLEKRSAFETPIAIAQSWFAGLIQGLYRDTFFIKDSKLQSAHFDIEVSKWNARGLRVQSARLPYAVASGLLEPDEVAHPVLALYYNDARLNLQPPEAL